MGIAFEPIGDSECVLCGASDNLTGEHKIKASLLRREFPNGSMMMSGVAGRRIAQSSKSKVFHFRSRLCSRCNSERTQAADRAFDQLHECLLARRAHGLPLVDADHRPLCSMEAKVQTDSFRYFSKILCLYLAEVGGPRPKALAAFAIGVSDRNCVKVRVVEDPTYESDLALLGTQGFASHGGLLFGFNPGLTRVEDMQSAIAVGGIRYEFWVRLRWMAALELELSYSELIRLARQQIVER